MNGVISADLKGSFTLLPLDDVHYGPGSITGLGRALGTYGVSRALVITGQTLGRSKLLERVLSSSDGRIAAVHRAAHQHVPRSAVLAAVEQARAINADAIISFGGGSPNDTAKAVVMALAEGIADNAGFDGQMIEFRYPDHIRIPGMQGQAVPLFAIPATLSAGEFTHFIGITDEVRMVKDLYIDKKLMAKAVFLDAELTMETPEWLWLSSGMRSVDHCIEALCSTTAHPFTDGLGSHALKMLARYLRETQAAPEDLLARTQLQIAAWMSVAGLANVTLGLSHGIGHQLGARCAVPHGHTSCVMMHHTMRFNAAHTADRQAWIAELLGVDVKGLDNAAASAAAANAVLQLTRDLGQPTSLREVGVKRGDFPAIAADAMQDMIVATNPRPIKTEAEIIELLESAF